MVGFDFTVDRANLEVTHLGPLATPRPGPGEILVAVERFAITTNNITYGVAGDSMGYWQFFPAADGEGRLPVWGVGTVVESNVAGVEVAGRYYGYFPMASHHRFLPAVVESGFIETADHRQTLPPLYNRYTEVSGQAGFPDGYDNHQAAYRILFETGFVLDAYLHANDYFGADQIVLSSASSKTSISAAFALERRDVDVIGLTSDANREFVEALDLYDDVVTYDEVRSLDDAVSTVYADMSGNGEVLTSVHSHFNQQLTRSIGLGATHRSMRGSGDRSHLGGPTPERFFAPTDIQRLIDQHGASGYHALLTPIWNDFLAEVDDWISMKEFVAPDDLETAYRSVLAGGSPDVAYVVKASGGSEPGSHIGGVG